MLPEPTNTESSSARSIGQAYANKAGGRLFVGCKVSISATSRQKVEIRAGGQTSVPFPGTCICRIERRGAHRQPGPLAVEHAELDGGIIVAMAHDSAQCTRSRTWALHAADRGLQDIWPMRGRIGSVTRATEGAQQRRGPPSGLCRRDPHPITRMS